MAFMECHFHSDVLGMATAMNVILPQASESQASLPDSLEGGEFPCLYLLHGLSDDHSIWMRRTSIERYVAPLGLAVIMPNVHRSFYSNMVNGYRYWDFMVEELPAVVRSMFRVSGDRSKTFVAGLSMGGFGAFKMGLLKGDKFAAAASFSGALNMAHRVLQDHEEAKGEERRNVFGELEDLPGSDNDLLAVSARAVEEAGELPFMYQWCGKEDFLYEDNVCFRQNAEKVGLDVCYEEGTGDHSWQYWDRQIVRFLDLLVERGLLAVPGQ